MNKKKWKAEYSKWRAVMRFRFAWSNRNDDMYSIVHKEIFYLMFDKSHRSIYDAIIHYEGRFFRPPKDRIDILCNLNMSKDSVEAKRLSEGVIKNE